MINGANLFYPEQFGIGSESTHDTILLGLVASAPYLCSAVFSCWLTYVEGPLVPLHPARDSRETRSSLGSCVALSKTRPKADGGFSSLPQLPPQQVLWSPWRHLHHDVLRRCRLHLGASRLANLRASVASLADFVSSFPLRVPSSTRGGTSLSLACSSESESAPRVRLSPFLPPKSPRPGFAASSPCSGRPGPLSVRSSSFPQLPVHSERSRGRERRRAGAAAAALSSNSQANFPARFQASASAPSRRSFSRRFPTSLALLA